MIKNIVIAVTAASMMVGVAHSKIEIKGYKTGTAWTHTNEHVIQDSKYMSLGGLSIADRLVSSVFLTSTIDRKKIGGIQFTLDSSDYFVVKEAIESKYKLKCIKSTIQNKMGATFNQELCNYTEAGDELWLQRYSGNIREMTLSIFDKEDNAKAAQARKSKSKKDL